MLVLSRRAGERIIITLPDGRNVALEVLEVRGDRVRLGLAAPADVPVNRAEVQYRGQVQSINGESHE